MKPGYRSLLWAAAVIAVGILVLMAVRSVGNDDAGAVAPQTLSTAAAVAAAAEDPAAAAPHAAAETPPWMQHDAAPAATGTALAQAVAGGAPPPAAMIEVGKSIADIRQQSQHNIRMADDLLLQLDALEKSGKAPPEMRIDALRNNLVVAKRAQLLARELAESTQLPDSPQRHQRHAEIVNELQQLQGQLRYDVTVAPPAAAAGRAQ
ncbi:hypothetical protein OK348_07115 [Flavobacterium sp. MXW15]|uniref:Uncharacterized protein n=1 Tax=Xanthomonas chitinilytica TaxID=2989819 RepID=A0ABT3JTI4_9XANT|nr:hypothetical protein [Xanthomonas sp. H13-6]MCW4454564.1 hypothetical protein [Flavobacterium sp. MXW15]MCW4471803.1 hypothetical protein [Xanthomonas sp. H13-6]